MNKERHTNLLISEGNESCARACPYWLHVVISAKITDIISRYFDDHHNIYLTIIVSYVCFLKSLTKTPPIPLSPYILNIHWFGSATTLARNMFHVFWVFLGCWGSLSLILYSLCSVQFINWECISKGMRSIVSISSQDISIGQTLLKYWK